ncbi:MAG: DUF1844 domain-containing protein [Candidatus Nanopelagicales bacterium]
MSSPGENAEAVAATRDLAALSAVEIVGANAVDLMTAAAVKLGLYEGTSGDVDLAEARILIDALGGLVAAAVPHLGHHHAAPLRDGLASLQKAFREAQEYPDPPGEGPGEAVTARAASGAQRDRAGRRRVD